MRDDVVLVPPPPLTLRIFTCLRIAFCCSTDRDPCDILYSRSSSVASNASSVVTLSSRLMSFTSVCVALMAFTRSCSGFACVNFSRMSLATSRMRSRTVVRFPRAALRSSCLAEMTDTAFSTFAVSSVTFSKSHLSSAVVPCPPPRGFGSIHSRST